MPIESTNWWVFFFFNFLFSIFVFQRFANCLFLLFFYLQTDRKVTSNNKGHDSGDLETENENNCDEQHQLSLDMDEPPAKRMILGE